MKNFPKIVCLCGSTRFSDNLKRCPYCQRMESTGVVITYYLLLPDGRIVEACEQCASKYTDAMDIGGLS
jgi:hypothetical protein